MTGQQVRHACHAAIAAIRALEAGDLAAAADLAEEAAHRHGQEAGFIAVRGLALSYAAQKLGRLPGRGDARVQWPLDGIGPGWDTPANVAALVTAAANQDIDGGRLLWAILPVEARRSAVLVLVTTLGRMASQRGTGPPPV